MLWTNEIKICSFDNIWVPWNKKNQKFIQSLFNKIQEMGLHVVFKFSNEICISKTTLFSLNTQNDNSLFQYVSSDMTYAPIKLSKLKVMG